MGTKMWPTVEKTTAVACSKNISSKLTKQPERIQQRLWADMVVLLTWNISAITVLRAKKTGKAAGRLMTPNLTPTMAKAMSPLLRLRFAFVVVIGATMLTLFLRYRQQQQEPQGLPAPKQPWLGFSSFPQSSCFNAITYFLLLFN